MTYPCAFFREIEFSFIIKLIILILQALYTAVWSVLKAKRRMLKFPEGFMAHFYGISEQLSPLLAWGFLGPDERLRDICLFFKVTRINKNNILPFFFNILN